MTRHPRLARARRAFVGAIALLAVVAVETASARVQDPRLLVAVGVLPQMRQYVDDTEVFAELTRAELMWPVGRAWRAGGEIAARSDFVILGANLHRDFWESPSREWRATVGLGYILPFADTDQLYERLHGDPSEIHDRMLLRLGVGQTFSLDRGRLAFRLGADGRLSPRGSVLAFLESLDDGPDVAESIVVVEVYAGFEVRLGGHP